MESIDLSNNVQLILDQLSFRYQTTDKNTFIIQKDERQYTVSLESLPEVRIERTEPLKCFEWHDSIHFAKCAAYFVNDASCLALVLIDEPQNRVSFRKEFTAETGWSIGAQLYRSLDEIDQTVTAFRAACSVDDELFELRLDEMLKKGLI